jgi:hypothetical protein
MRPNGQLGAQEGDEVVTHPVEEDRGRPGGRSFLRKRSYAPILDHTSRQDWFWQVAQKVTFDRRP